MNEVKNLKAYLTGRATVFLKDGEPVVELVNKLNGKPIYLNASLPANARIITRESLREHMIKAMVLEPDATDLEREIFGKDEAR